MKDVEIKLKALGDELWVKREEYENKADKLNAPSKEKTINLTIALTLAEVSRSIDQIIANAMLEEREK